MGEETRDGQLGDSPEEGQSRPTDREEELPQSAEDAMRRGNVHISENSIQSSGGSVGLIASIAALTTAGLTGVAAIIRAWAQLLLARADMIRARLGRTAADGERGEAEPAEEASRRDNEAGA